MPSSEASLDSIDSTYDSDEEYRLAQEEWQESLQQLQQLVSMVALPMLGKFFGRRWSYWGQSNSSLTACLSLGLINSLQHTRDTFD